MRMILLLALGFQLIWSQGRISGFVFDEASIEGLIGVNVYLKDTSYGTTTNHNGYFVITDIPPGNYTLLAQYLGYEQYSRELTITANTDLVERILIKEALLEAEGIQVVADSLPTMEQLYNKPVSRITLRPQQINNLPQIAEADLLRTLQTLPGILAANDFSSDLYIRGGTPDQNLYLIDGADIYNPEHLFGLFSSFNTDAIKDVEISKGGFNAYYGGRLSSILDVTNLDGNRKEFEGSAAISLLSAKTTLQTPIGNLGSISGSFRRTYFDKTVAPFIEEVPNYYFYDGHAKAFLDLSPRNKLSISFYGGEDVLNYELANSGGDLAIEYDWRNITSSIRWTHIFTPQAFANFWVTGSSFDSKFGFNTLEDINKITDLTFKGDIEYRYSNTLDTRFGFESKFLNMTFEQQFSGGQVYIDQSPTSHSAYVHLGWKATPKWLIETGVRLDYFSAGETFFKAGPRLAMKYRLSDYQSIKFATGLYHQYLGKIPRFIFSDIWGSANQFYNNGASVHAILGYQQELSGSVQLEIETYYKGYDEIIANKPFIITEVEPSYYNEDDLPVYTSPANIFYQGDGYSYGFEMMLRRDAGSINGWLAYSLGYTRYIFDTINNNDFYYPRHDRRHTFNAVGNIMLDKYFSWMASDPNDPEQTHWRLGTNFIYASGQPITTTGSVYFTDQTPDQELPSYNIYPAEKNNFRLPAYIRMDISLTYERILPTWTWSMYLQIYNVGNRGNLWFYQYVDEFKDNGLGGFSIDQTVDPIYQIPFLPTIGAKFTF
jgi:hypothetical protein